MEAIHSGDLVAHAQACVILFLLVESLLRRDLNQQFKERVYQTAFVFLILVFALVLVNDLSKFSIFARLHP